MLHSNKRPLVLLIITRNKLKLTSINSVLLLVCSLVVLHMLVPGITAGFRAEVVSFES